VLVQKTKATIAVGSSPSNALQYLEIPAAEAFGSNASVSYSLKPARNKSGDNIDGPTFIRSIGSDHTHDASTEAKKGLYTSSQGGNSEYKPKYYAVIAWQRTA
jgi:hypothetical protein